MRKSRPIVQNWSLFLCSVADSDLTLCVLSLPEFLKDRRIPEVVSPLVTSNTLYLLNKSDLVCQSDIEFNHSVLDLSHNVWIMSLTTGCGMKDFLSGLGAILNDRFVRFPSLTFRVKKKNIHVFLDSGLPCGETRHHLSQKADIELIWKTRSRIWMHSCHYVCLQKFS